MKKKTVDITLSLGDLDLLRELVDLAEQILDDAEEQLDEDDNGTD